MMRTNSVDLHEPAQGTPPQASEADEDAQDQRQEHRARRYRQRRGTSRMRTKVAALEDDVEFPNPPRRTFFSMSRA